jgi:hypothetical protein
MIKKKKKREAVNLAVNFDARLRGHLLPSCGRIKNQSEENMLRRCGGSVSQRRCPQDGFVIPPRELGVIDYADARPS